MTPEELARKADSADLRLVRFLWCGNDGTIRAKASRSRAGRPARARDRRHRRDAGDERARPVAAGRGDGAGGGGAARARPRHVPHSPVRAAHRRAAARPHAPRRRAGAGLPADVPQAAGGAAAERGAVLRAAFENEFSLATRRRRASTCRSTPRSASRRSASPRPRATPTSSWPRSRRRGSWSSSSTPSSATASRSSRPRTRPALQAADEQLLVRETIRGVASRLGLVASLAPKPWPDNAGNGCHIHFSLWDADGRNRFYDAAATDNLSGEAVAFLAGVLDHLPGLCGLTAPSFNSYRRIVPQYWAGAYACWGHDNREAPIRVPPSSAAARRRRRTPSSRPPTRRATRTSRSAG